MFPHTITIYIYDETSEVYSRQIVKGVYWEGSESVPISTTRSHSSNTSIVIPKGLMNEVKVVNGCFIAKGEQPEIKSVTDLNDMESIQVSSIEVTDVGSELDNITVNGN